MRSSILSLAAAFVAAFTALPAVRADITPYDCTALHVGTNPATADARVVASWRELAEETERDGRWAVRVVVAAIETPPRLDVETRVRVQHQLVAIGRALDGRTDDAAHVARTAVAALARASAPTAEELAALGDPATPAVTAVLGSYEGIAQRATRTCGEGNSIHAHYFHGALAFRPLRAGTTRALVATLVAYDRDGVPHVTPLVETIELRLGLDVDAPACVVEAGDDGALRAMPFAQLHAHAPFVVRDGNGVTCNGCHHSANAMHARDIEGDELTRVDSLRTRQVERLAAGHFQALAR